MIVISNGHVKGYMFFFPNPAMKRHIFQARDFGVGIRYAIPRILFQITFTCLYFIYIESPTVLDVLSILSLCYIGLKFVMTKHVRIDIHYGSWSYSLAPPILWIDHLTLFAMLFVLVFSNNNVGTLYDSISLFVEVLVIFLGLCPIFAYFSYRKYAQRRP